MAAPNKRSVPVDLQPGVFKGRVGFEDTDVDDPTLNDAQRAFTSLSQTLDEVYNREVAIRSDPTKTEADKILRVSELATKNLTAPGNRMQRARDAIEQQIKSTSSEIDRGLRSRMDPADAREIRDYVRGLTAEKRRAFLNRADGDTVAAVLSGKSFLSGLSDADALAIRHKRFPAEVKRLSKLEKARDQIDEGWTRYMSHLSTLQDRRASELASKAEAANRAMQEPVESE